MHRFVLKKGSKILHVKARLCTKAQKKYFQIWSREDRLFARWKYIAFAEDESSIRTVISHCFGYSAVITEMR